MLWLFILVGLLGFFCYFFIVERVRSVTRTSPFLLWIVVMMPAFCLTAWALVYGPRVPMPPLLGLITFLVFFVLYLYLIQRGSIKAPAIESPPEKPVAKAMEPVVRSLSSEDEERLRTCFPWECYYLSNIEYLPQAVICRGNLRSASSETAYRTIESRVQDAFGDRFFLVFQEGLQERPFFALVPNPQMAMRITPEMMFRPKQALLLVLATAVSCIWSGQLLLIQVGASTSPSFLEGLPYALGLMGFFLIREGGHYWTTARYGILATLPYFIPIVPLPQLPIGTLGAFIQIRSPIPNRRALFDVGVIGAVMGLVVAIGLLGWGLTLSQVIPQPPAFRPSVFKFEAMLPQYSIALALVAKLALGSSLATKTAIAMHPIAVAGWLGTLFTAFNLMPVGQLDGGRMVHAIFGQRQGSMIGQVARISLLLLSFMQPHLLLLSVLLFFLPTMDEPALNDVTPLDSRRDLLGILVLLVLLIIIIPAPKVLITALGL
ncbi:MAG: site-2 protease family protein [Alkalinema sp. CAN_BIN05]|nr:site-2 protease family protein [Alkalinema sp. CAN_BIN05]